MSVSQKIMQILMPKVGLTMTEGSIVQWHKREGDFVARGEPLFTFETEKSTLEFESPAEGILSEILIPAGQVVACFVPVAEVGGDRAARPEPVEGSNVKREDQVMSHESRVMGEANAPLRGQHSAPSTARKPISPRARMRAREMGIDVEAVRGSGPEGAVRERDVVSVKREVSNVSPSPLVRATPVAQRIATEMGIDLAQIRGTGRDGVITREDVERQRMTDHRRPTTDQGTSSPHPPTTSSSNNEPVPLTPIRRITAQRMTENAQTAPHVTLTTEADASALVSAREQISAELGEKLSYNALLIAIAAKALSEHPAVNTSWVEKTTDDRRPTTDDVKSSVVGGQSSVVFRHSSIHIGLAVDTPRGLLVPVLRDCGGKGLAEIHRQLGDVVARAQVGKARPDELSGGTFTITNLGMFEIDAFTPIINLPEAAILGVGRIVKKAIVLDDDRIVPRPMMTLSLSFDHRVMDGATAAKFLQRVKQLVERPMALMLG